MARCAWVVLAVMLWAAACVPARTPPQLGATPGPAVVVTDTRYTNALFTVARPAEWRVVTSAAGEPPSVIFVSPDDTALIAVSTEPQTAPPIPPDLPAGAVLVEQAEQVTLDGLTVYLYVAAPDTDWPRLHLTWRLVLGSVALNDSLN